MFYDKKETIYMIIRDHWHFGENKRDRFYINLM